MHNHVRSNTRDSPRSWTFFSLAAIIKSYSCGLLRRPRGSRRVYPTTWSGRRDPLLLLATVTITRAGNAELILRPRSNIAAKPLVKCSMGVGSLSIIRPVHTVLRVYPRGWEKRSVKMDEADGGEMEDGNSMDGNFFLFFYLDSILFYHLIKRGRGIRGKGRVFL